MSADQRKKKYIDPKVQGTLARRLIFHYVVFLIGSCIFAFLLQLLTNPFVPPSQAARELWWTQGPFILVAFCLIPVFVNDTIKLSHRFVGPIVRVHSEVKRCVEGEDVKPIKLRPGDFWREFVEDFNTLLARNNKRQVQHESVNSDEQREPAVMA